MHKGGACVNMLWKRYSLLFAVLYLLLGTWKGYVALFENGCGEPRQIFPCCVDTLPDEDRQALEQMIPIRNHRDLQQALEDYLS